jgi:hypothetical protein
VPPKVGILAGGGDLPGNLVAACRNAGREVFVITFEGQDQPAGIEAIPHARLGIGAVGKILKCLEAEGCQEVIFAGRLQRPSLKSIKVDFRGARLLPKIAAAGGDDALMTLIVAEIESAGFRVIAPDDLMPALLASAGPLGRHRPQAADETDIARGVELLATLGAYDMGQAVVIEGGRVLAIEGPEGTAAMLGRIKVLKQSEKSGVLVKCLKPGQEDRADRPAIGPDTVTQAAAAGLNGIAVEAGVALIINRDEVAGTADAAGLFVTAIERGAG